MRLVWKSTALVLATAGSDLGAGRRHRAAAGGGGTCLSPYVKRLDRPERYLYVFCVDADARDNDFVSVIDVNPDSSTYGTILNTVDLGTKGNETHHWGYTDDPTRIWAGGCFTTDLDSGCGDGPGQAAHRKGD